jgi:hypothetical protein
MYCYTLKRIPLILSGFIITSCATIYVPPVGGPTSDLIIPIENRSFYKRYVAFEDSTIFFAVADDKGCGSLSKIPAPKNEGDSSVTVKIPRNKDILVKFYARFGNWQCKAMGTFSVDSVQDYRINTYGDGQRCKLVVSKVDNDDNLIPVALKNVEVDFFSGKLCVSSMGS